MHRSRFLYILIATIVVFSVFFYSPLPDSVDHHRDALVQQLANTAKLGDFGNHTTPDKPVDSKSGHYVPTGLDDVKSQYAFATFLSGSSTDPNDHDPSHDPYFQATRILSYQLLHAPETRSKNASIPFIVLVTKDVPEEKRSRLRKDGAHVVPVTYLTADWITTDYPAWRDVLTKLRLWELTQFERVCFLDGDTILTGPLDDVFDDPAVHLHHTGTDNKAIKSDEAPLPRNYSFAGVPESKPIHKYPPTDENHDYPNINYLNSGFFVYKPSLDVENYYISLMNIPDRFNPELPEQNLFNYAHRREGNMPWTQLANTWNIHYPSIEDLNGGVRTLHEKWWAPVNEGLRPYLESWRWRMEGFHEARDSVLEQQKAKGGFRDFRWSD